MEEENERMQVIERTDNKDKTSKKREIENGERKKTMEERKKAKKERYKEKKL